MGASMLWIIIGFCIIVMLFVIGAPIWLAFLTGSAVLLTLGIGTSGTTVAVQYTTGVDSFTMMAIPFFIFAGNIMAYGGASLPIFNFMNSFLGKRRAGIPIAVVLTSMVYAAITGSTVACLSAVSSICLPIMRKAGYSDKYTAGVISISSTMGNLIPPSLLMIVYAGIASQDVSKLFLSGIIPGILCGLVIAGVAYFKSPKLEELTVVYPPETYSAKNRLKSLGRGLPALLMPIIILGSIYAGIMTPTEAAALSCAYGLIVSIFYYRGMTLAGFKQTMRETANSNAMIFVMAGSAFVFAQPITRLGIPQLFASMIADAGFSKFELILAVAAIMLIMGCFLDSMPILYLVLPIVLPAMRAVGVDLIHFNVVMIICMQIGQVTPPFGVALYLAAKLMDVPIVPLIKEVIPYLLGVLILMLVLIFVPQLSLFLV